MEGLSTDVGDFWVGASVKVLDNPTSLEFLRECVATYQPAIIRGLIHDWPAMREWNLSKVCEKLEQGTSPSDHGKRLLKVNVTPDGHGDCLKGNGNASSSNASEKERVFVYPAECLMSTALFHQMMTAPLKDDAVPYLSLQNDNLRLEMRELMVDISDSIQIAEDAFGQSQPEAVNLWIGDERSVSSIHKDHFENMYAVITGEKTFTLLPPTDLLYLEEKDYPCMQYRVKGTQSTVTSSTAVCIDGTEPHVATLINRVKAADLELTRNGCPTESLTWIGTDPDDPNVITRHPTFRHAHPLRCKIQPGEILYIPAMWYHQVSQTTLTIAVNYWYDQRFDFRYVFYQSIKRLKNQLTADGKEEKEDPGPKG